jgi:hypothetical protein
MEGLDRKSIIVIVGILAVVVIGSFLMSRGGTAEDDLNTNTDDQIGETDDRENFADETSGVDLGRIVIAENIDRDSCPVDSASTLDSDTDQFYVVSQDTTFEQGSDFFVRLYRDGQAVEDSPLVAAEDNYEDICIYAVFQSDGGFDRGDYEAEFIVNGNPSESVEFSVR